MVNLKTVQDEGENSSIGSVVHYIGDSAPISDAPLTVPLLPDPGFLWQVFRRNFWLFALVLLFATLPALYFIRTIPPVYAARASILIEPTAEPIRTTAPGQANGIVNADEVDTEIRLIGSPLVAERAAFLYAEKYVDQEITSTLIDSITQSIATSVRVTRSGQTRIADVTATNVSPEFTARAANVVAEAYLGSQVEAKTSRTDASAAFINARLKELERNALDAQTRLDNYKAENDLVSAQGLTNSDQEVSLLNQQVTTAEADLNAAQARLDTMTTQLSSGGGGEDVGATLNSATISSLRQSETVASSRLSVLVQRYGPAHPERQQAEAELETIQSRIEEEIARILSSLEADVQTAQSRVRSLRRSLSEAKGRRESTNYAQAGLSRLMQQAEAAQSIYSSFLERSQETGALRDSAMPDAMISAKAEIPTAPVGPRYKVLSVAAGILGLGLAIFSILIAEYLRRGVQTKRDVEKRLRIRYAGAVPTLRSTVGWRKSRLMPHEYVLKHPQSIFAESFRSIRAFLTLSPGSRPRAIAITSALPGEGKTTTALCIAIATAAEGVNTVLVDADMRRMGSSRTINYTAEKDIYDYVLDGADLSDCLYTDPASNLKVLGSTATPDHNRNPLREELVIKMFEELRQKFDVIIVDTAPLLGVADGRVIATLADRVLMVTRWKKTSMRAVEAVTSMLLDTKAKLTGLALTQVNIKKYASTGDGDVYAYTKKFRGYYNN